MTSIIDHVARELADEAVCARLSNISWDNSAEERKDAWRMCAIAAISAMRDEVGHTIVDKMLAPEREAV
jgi:hypothetical protein